MPSRFSFANDVASGLRLDWGGSSWGSYIPVPHLLRRATGFGRGCSQPLCNWPTSGRERVRRRAGKPGPQGSFLGPLEGSWTPSRFSGSCPLFTEAEQAGEGWETRKISSLPKRHRMSPLTRRQPAWFFLFPSLLGFHA